MINFYSVYDKKLKFYSCPFYGIHDFAVIESVLKTIDLNERSHYQIYKVGEFNPSTNEFIPASTFICDLEDYAVVSKVEKVEEFEG